MADVKHKVERAAFGAAIDGILKYVNKDEEDREKAFLKLGWICPKNLWEIRFRRKATMRRDV